MGKKVNARSKSDWGKEGEGRGRIRRDLMKYTTALTRKKGGMVGQVSSRKEKQKRIQGSRAMTQQLDVVVVWLLLLLSLLLMLMLASVSIGGKK